MTSASRATTRASSCRVRGRGRSARRPVRVARHRGRGRADRAGVETAAAPSPGSRSASAASTAAIPRRSSSSSRRARLRSCCSPSGSDRPARGRPRRPEPGVIADAVIPALDEAEAIGGVLDALPRNLLRRRGLRQRIARRNGEIAGGRGAMVVREERRGYGSACPRRLAVMRRDPPRGRSSSSTPTEATTPAKPARSSSRSPAAAPIS